MQKNLTPDQIIDALGGTSEVARLCEVQPPSVSEWRKLGIPKSRLKFLMAVRPEVFGVAAPAPPSAPRRSTDPEPPAAPARPFRKPPSRKNVMELHGLDGSRSEASVPAPAEPGPAAPATDTDPE